MGGYGLQSDHWTLCWLGITCISAYMTYAYCKKSINKDYKKAYRVKFMDKIQKRMILVGLKNSGKTSLVNQIFFANETDMNRTTLLGLTRRSLTVLDNTSYRYNIYEINGNGSVETWQYACMYLKQDLIIFVIDSSNVNKLPLAIKLLKDVICDPRIKETPILIVASKQDHSNALGSEQIKEAVNLPSSIVNLHKIEVIGCQTKPLPDLPKGGYASQYHSSVDAVRKKIFSMGGL